MKSVPCFSGRPGFPEGLQVLLVDEDAAARDTATALLRQCAYQVRSCCSASDACDALALPGTSYDVVMVETKVLSRKGAKDVKRLQGAVAELPLILMSQSAAPDEVMTGIKSWRAVDFLEKPLSVLKLRTIWQHTVRKQMQSSKSLNKLCANPSSQETDSVLRTARPASANQSGGLSDGRSSASTGIFNNQARQPETSIRRVDSDATSCVFLTKASPDQKLQPTRRSKRIPRRTQSVLATSSALMSPPARPAPATAAAPAPVATPAPAPAPALAPPPAPAPSLGPSMAVMARQAPQPPPHSAHPAALPQGAPPAPPGVPPHCIAWGTPLMGPPGMPISASWPPSNPTPPLPMGAAAAPGCMLPCATAAAPTAARLPHVALPVAPAPLPPAGASPARAEEVSCSSSRNGEGIDGLLYGDDLLGSDDLCGGMGDSFLQPADSFLCLSNLGCDDDLLPRSEGAPLLGLSLKKSASLVDLINECLA